MSPAFRPWSSEQVLRVEWFPMSSDRCYVRVLSVVLMALFTMLPACEFAFCESSVEYARSVVEMAGESLESAYLSVVEAERSGGDVSELVSYLRVAVGHLSEAERALEMGDYDGASLLADKADEAAKDILLIASRLGDFSIMQGRIAFGYRLLVSFGVFMVIMIYGFLGWKTFRGYYFRRLMELKPEVSVDES